MRAITGLLIAVTLFRVGHSLPQRSDCSSSSPNNKKCKTKESTFNRPCASYFDCKFQPEGCETSAWFACDGTKCVCELFGFARDDFGPLMSVNWDEGRKGGLCAVSVGGPCGRDDGLEVKCETGYQCIDSQCQKMPRKQSTKGGCGQEEGCEFGSVDPPCPDPRGCEFGRVLPEQSAEFQPKTIPSHDSRNKGCDERHGSCENRHPERQTKGKARVKPKPKPKRIEMEESGEMMEQSPRGGGSGSIFPPSSFRARASSTTSCGSDKKGAESCGEDDDDRGSKPEGASQGCSNNGGRGKGDGCGSQKPKSKPMGPRPNAPKPCREGNCGKRTTTTTPRPTTRKSCSSGGGCGRKTTPAPSGCGNKGSGGCGRRTTERADKPPGCGGNENSGCGGGSSGGGRKKPPKRPTVKPGCRSEGGCGGGGGGGGGQERGGRPKNRPGPTPCKEGSNSGCEAEVPKSKGCGNKRAGGCGTTTTTPKPNCKEDNSCEGGSGDDDKDEETRCDKFFPKLFNMQCPR